MCMPVQRVATGSIFLFVLPCVRPTFVYFTVQIRGSMLDAGADVFVSGLLDEVSRSGFGVSFFFAWLLQHQRRSFTQHARYIALALVLMRIAAMLGACVC